MREIPQELLKFKESLSGKDSDMKIKVSNIKSKLSDLINSNNAAKTGIDSNYDSENKNSLLNSFNSLNNNLNEIISSLDTLNNILSEVTELIEKIKNIEILKKAIESLEEKLSSEKSKTENRDESIISNLESEIKEKIKQYDEEIDSALDELNELRSKEISLNVAQEVAPASTKLYGKAGLGDFERYQYTASNGVKVDYLVYVPNYGKPVEKLPINMYMHGSGTGNNSFSRLTESGLGKEIIEGNVLPSGIVILPLAPTGKSYDNKNFRDALAEIPLKVAKDYNADTSRISLSGHSWGAITAYDLVNEHPNEFSAIVISSGSDKVTSAFMNTKVWAFHGSEDEREGSRTAYSQAVNVINEIKRLGGDAELYTYEGKGHSDEIQKDMFNKEFEKNGEYINPLEWAFSQTRA